MSYKSLLGCLLIGLGLFASQTAQSSNVGVLVNPGLPAGYVQCAIVSPFGTLSGQSTCQYNQSNRAAIGGARGHISISSPGSRITSFDCGKTFLNINNELYRQLEAVNQYQQIACYLYDETQITSQVPTDFKPCAKDSGKCDTFGKWYGYYGAQNKFVKISGDASFTCLPASFGFSDPLPGVQKTCYIKHQEGTFTSEVPSDFKPCAKDFGKCETIGNWNGYYGAQNRFIKISGTDSFTCLPQNLGVADPLPGVQKTCYMKEDSRLSVLDPKFYLSHHPDLVNAFGFDLNKAKSHWLIDGIREGRQSSETFSIRHYIQRYNDLTVFTNNHARALQHWLEFGLKEGRDPSPITATTTSNTQTTSQTTSNNAIIWRRLNSPVHYWPVVNGQAQGGKNIGPAVDNQWVLSGAGDLNGDNKDDIVWRHASTGQVLAWFSQDAQQSAKIGPPVGSEWRLAGAGDINRDGNDDLIWQRNDGQVIYWPIVNGQAQGGKSIGAPVATTSFRLIGSGDLNKDGTDDIIWQRRDGQVHYWPIQNGQPQRGVNIGNPVPPEWKLIGAGDINSDGTDDLIWHNKNGQAHYWPIQNAQPQRGINIGSPVGPEWTLIGLGSF